jgi:hypothetical protein
MNLKKVRWIFAIVLIFIAMYKLNHLDATRVIDPPSATPEKLSTDEGPVAKDPFKEFIEKQSQMKVEILDQEKPSQGNQSRDPFKEFLDNQNKELNQSKVSPFGPSK